jgi:hypothetical protein
VQKHTVVCITNSGGRGGIGEEEGERNRKVDDERGQGARKRKRGIGSEEREKRKGHWDNKREEKGCEEREYVFVMGIGKTAGRGKRDKRGGERE